MTPTRLKLALTAVCAVAAAAPTATAAAAEPPRAQASAYDGTYPYGGVATDGERFAAFMPRRSVLRVIDTRSGTRYAARVPRACSRRADAELASVGGGQALVQCQLNDPESDTYERLAGVLLDLRRRRWHWPKGAVRALRSVGDDEDRSGSAWLADVGARWLSVRVRSDDVFSHLWLDWRTGAVRRSSGGSRRAIDLDAPGLDVPLCAPLRRRHSTKVDVGFPLADRYGPSLFDGRRLLWWGEGTTLRIQACGSDAVTRLQQTNRQDHLDGLELGGGWATWWGLHGYHAYLPACAVRATWRRAAGSQTADGLYDLRKVSPPGDRRERWRLHRIARPACPARPLVRGATVTRSDGRAAAATLRLASWPHRVGGPLLEQMVPVDRRTPVLRVRRGGRLTLTLDRVARSVRTQRHAGYPNWPRATGHGTRWTVRLEPRPHGVLRIRAKYPDGGDAHFILRVRSVD